MRQVLDSEHLDGPLRAIISHRPLRYAIPISPSVQSLVHEIDFVCQVWGGASYPLLPLDASNVIPHLYSAQLVGAQVDSIMGTASVISTRSIREAVNMPIDRETLALQLGLGVLPYRESHAYLPLKVTLLDEADPWYGIYAACLGRLPETIDASLVANGQWVEDIGFADFNKVSREQATGSWEDLCHRLEARVLTPRTSSMLTLAYGNQGATTIRSNQTVIASPLSAAFDAGPNIVVICSPNDVQDLALLWNLRAANGDHYAMPIGIPVGAVTQDLVGHITHSASHSLHGISAKQFYITSTSLSVDELRDLLGPANRSGQIVEPQQLLHFGRTMGWTHDEVLTWSKGRTSYVEFGGDIVKTKLPGGVITNRVAMRTEVRLPSAPMPDMAPDIRLQPLHGSVYGGAWSTWKSASGASGTSALSWPSRLTIAEAVAAHRGFELRESEPGRAAKFALDGMGDLSEVVFLRHRPLLDLLEDMASAQGMSWQRRRAREGASVERRVGESVDNLSDKTFDAFKRVFGNSQRATSNWLAWAEAAEFIVRGFQFTCTRCNAKQWLPVTAFSPPIICRGCGLSVQQPFADQRQATFRYRLSERARRVYEHDAIGHLLVASFFDSIFQGSDSSRIIGLHPGMRNGDFVPVEVKSRAAGMHESELAKLQALAEQISAPWSVAAVCQYHTIGDDAPHFALYDEETGAYSRMYLSFNNLLDLHAVWTFGDDPFKVEPMSQEDVQIRETEYVSWLSNVDALQRENSFEATYKWIPTD
jgi:hypothetical protein